MNLSGVEFEDEDDERVNLDEEQKNFWARHRRALSTTVVTMIS